MPERRPNRSDVASKKEKVKSQRAKAGSRSLAFYWLGAFLGIALVLLLATVGVLYAGMAEGRADRTAALRGSSGILANDLERRVATLRSRMQAWARDPMLRAAVVSGNAASLRTREQALKGQAPQAMGIRLLPAGYDAAGAQAGDMSYAGLDLIHQAEKQRKVTELEVHRLGHPDVHLAIAGPVLDEAGTSSVGVIYVALPLSWLPVLPAPDHLGDRLGLQQQVDDLAVTVDPRGGGAVASPPPDVATPVPNTRLRLAGWVAREVFPPAGQLVYAGIGYALILALAAAVLWVAWRTLKAALAADHATAVALIEDAAAGRPLRHSSCQLSESRPVLEVITRLLRDSQPAPAKRLPAEPMPPVERARAKGAPPSAAGPKGPPPPAPGKQAASPASPEPAPPAAAASHQTPVASPKVAAPLAPSQVPAGIFRAYDIRGVVGEGSLTPALMRAIGCAVGTAAAEAGDQTVTVARDTRPSGVELSQALVEGLRASGRDVVDLGVTPTPMLYFATCHRGLASGVMVTGSHNPPDHNGLKVVIAGKTLQRDGIRGLRDRVLGGRCAQGEGDLQEGDVTMSYIDRVEKDIAIAYTMKVVVDCGNGAASLLAPRLYRGLGCEVICLDCDPEAGFPGGRVLDPANPECLAVLQKRVVDEKADLGFAFDPDGDRLGVVDSSGKIIWTDRVLMLLAADVLSRHPGTDVVFDVKCSHHLGSQILKNGGRPVMWQSGHSPLKAKLLETGAMLAGEWSGHIMFRERWFGFDDAIYAGARLLEVLALDPRPSAEVFAALPEAISTPELFVPLAEGEAGRIMEAVLQYADRLEGVGVQTIDGLRADSERAWGLVRASNTQPALAFRFEGDDEAALNQIKDLFRRLMTRVTPDLSLPF